GARGSLDLDRHTMPRVVHVPLEIPHRGRISRLAGTARILRTNDDLLPARAKAQGCLPKSPRPGVRIAHQPRGLPVHSAVGGHLYPRDLATAGKRIPRGRKMPGPETLTLPGSTDARAYPLPATPPPGTPPSRPRSPLRRHPRGFRLRWAARRAVPGGGSPRTGAWRSQSTGQTPAAGTPATAGVRDRPDPSPPGGRERDRR